MSTPWWEHPPTLRVVRIINLVLAMICLLLAWWNGVSVTGMVDMFLAGLNGAAAIYGTLQIRMTESMRRMGVAFDELHQLNQALIENRVKMYIEGIGDEPPPTQPRLH